VRRWSGWEKERDRREYVCRGEGRNEGGKEEGREGGMLVCVYRTILQMIRNEKKAFCFFIIT